MAATPTSKAIEGKARELLVLSVEATVIDTDQLVRLATLDQQVEMNGVKDLTGLSDDELIEDLLSE